MEVVPDSVQLLTSTFRHGGSLRGPFARSRNREQSYDDRREERSGANHEFTR